MHITGVGVLSCSRIDERGLGVVAGEWGWNRALSLGLNAARAAMREAGWDAIRPSDGVILATTTGQYLMWDQAFLDLAGGRGSREEFREKFRHQPLYDLGRRLRSVLGADGPSTVLTTACTAGTQAVALAALWVGSGRCARVLVGGVEVLCPMTIEGFRSLQLLSSEPARPFDRARKGINLSEGAGFLCVEGAESSGRSLARVAGSGFSSDGYHPTSPHPEGRGSARAMAAALKSAGIAADEIDWVHAHGTGSLHNDLSEAAAIRTIFGPEPAARISSTKGRHGHALGASGAIECAMVVRALRDGRVLGTDGLTEVDPAVGMPILREDLRQPVRHVLKNTLGFGGANAAVVLSC